MSTPAGFAVMEMERQIAVLVTMVDTLMRFVWPDAEVTAQHGMWLVTGPKGRVSSGDLLHALQMAGMEPPRGAP